jgi:hypothetical protein
MSQETKLSILRSLLARVQKRATGRREERRSFDGTRAGGPDPFGARNQAAKPIEPAAPMQASKVELPEPESEAIEPVPPSAPRVREAAVDALAGEPAEAAASEPAEEEIDIAITISDHPPPGGQGAAVEIPAAPPVSGFTTMADAAEDGRLELEELTPPVEAIDEDEAPTATRARMAPAPAEEPPAMEARAAPTMEPPAIQRDELSWPPAAPPEPPPAFPVPRAAPPPQAAPPMPAPRLAPPPQAAPPPAVGLRMMVEPEAGAPAVPLDVAPDGGGVAGTRVEVAPAVHAAPIRGPVGTFIERSRFFFPNSFGELLDASLGLGNDRS